MKVPTFMLLANADVSGKTSSTLVFFLDLLRQVPTHRKKIHYACEMERQESCEDTYTELWLGMASLHSV